jgi:hypothetical protein
VGRGVGSMSDEIKVMRDGTFKRLRFVAICYKKRRRYQIEISDFDFASRNHQE